MPEEKIGDPITVYTAAHPPRVDSPEYRKTREWLMKTSGGCFICGGPVDLSHPGIPGNPTGLEDHHGGGIFMNEILVGLNLFPLEWSMGWGADPKKVAAFVKQLRDAGLTTYDVPITDTKGVMAWVDSVNNANVKLCKAHHLGHQTEHTPDHNGHEAVGIHNAPWPILAAQATCDWDRFDMWAGTTGTVAVSSDHETPGGTIVTYVHEAHPVRVAVGHRLPASHPHSRAAHNGYRKRRLLRRSRTTG